jgi:hypothetical protein
VIDPDTIAGAVLPALVSGAVTWGVMRTEMRWLRRDVDDIRKRVADHENHGRIHTHRRRDDPLDA